jgi:capsule polysaccharide modification protein KpsS
LLLGLDLAWLVRYKVTGSLLDLEEYWIGFRNRLKQFFMPIKITKKLQQDEFIHSILFLGQVRSDVNHTHFGISDSELEKAILQILEDDKSIHIIWRDHPYERLDRLFLSLSTDYPGRILRSNQSPLKAELIKCEGVVTVNSNGGLEALSFGLPVLLLGSSYLSHLKGACKNIAFFKKYRHEIRIYGPNKFIAKGAKDFLRGCFLPIDFRLEDFSNAHLAARLLMMNKK